MAKNNKQETNNQVNNNNNKKIIIILVICFLTIIVMLLIFMMYFFNNFDHIKKGSLSNIFEINVKGDDNFVFLGDSITEGYELKEFYENLPVVNSGSNGNTTDDILEDMENRVYKYNPSKVFILIGTNDITRDKDSEYIFKNIVKIVDNIKKNRPFAKIYVESIYPVNNSDDEKIDMNSVKNRTNEQIDEINSMLKKEFKDTDVTYIDINSKLKENGQLKLDYTKEGLHLSNLGYINVTRILLSYMKDE